MSKDQNIIAIFTDSPFLATYETRETDKSNNKRSGVDRTEWAKT